MSTVGLPRAKRPAAAVRVGLPVLWLLVAALAVGLVAMHALGLSTAALGAGAHGATGSVSEHGHQQPNDAIATAQHQADHEERHADCPIPAGTEHDEPCPDQHGHAGPMCESGAVPGGPAFGLPALVTILDLDTSTSQQVTVTTAASSAAGGSGCGPPSLTELSISRT